MKLGVALAAMAAQAAAGPAAAFCGFYVAQADSKLFNKSSKVVLTPRRQADRHHHGERLRRRGQGIRAGHSGADLHRAQADRRRRYRRPIDHLDAYSAPRLVEYSDEDPCRPPMPMAVAWRRRAAGCERSIQKAPAITASPSRRATTSANMTSRSCRRPRMTASSTGSPTTATKSPPAPGRCSAAISSRTCISSSPR